MPSYVYECGECGEIIEVFHSMSSELSDCELCKSNDTLRKIPEVPIFLDSPLAIKVTEIYKKRQKYVELVWWSRLCRWKFR